MSKHAQRRNYRVNNDLHIHIGDPPADVAAAFESCRIDAAEDREWFRRHPHETRRERPASVRELRAHSLPIGTVVVVLLGPFGGQVRMFFPPVDAN